MKVSKILMAYIVFTNSSRVEHILVSMSLLHIPAVVDSQSRPSCNTGSIVVCQLLGCCFRIMPDVSEFVLLTAHATIVA